MLDGSEYSFECEDDLSLVASVGEEESHNIMENDSDDDFSACSSQVDSLSSRLEHSGLGGKERAVKSPNSLSSVRYRPLSVSHYIQEHLIRPGEKLQRDFLPDFRLEEAILLLHYKKWLVDEVTSDYFDNWPKLRDACGLGQARDVRHEIRRRDFFACPICCETGSFLVFSLQCNHEFCAPCYKQYVMLNLSRGVILRCMDTQCRLSLLYSDVSRLLAVKLPPEDNAATFLSKSTGLQHVGSSGSHQNLEIYGNSDDIDLDALDDVDFSFERVDFFMNPQDPLAPNLLLLSNALLVNTARVSIDELHSKFRWCPAVDCSQLVEFVAGSGEVLRLDAPEKDDLSEIAIVTCGNNHEFCFDCHYENHLPCPCWLAKSWIKRCEDDSETVNWMDANTQGCPNCEAVIEKNGGCNHMVCSKCVHEFCWICLGDWAMHNSSYWQCNRFDPEEAKEKKRSHKQNSLSRYLHFYRRFAVHQVSMNCDQKTLKNVHRCMFQYMKAQTLSGESTGSWNYVRFLSDAIRSLSGARKSLMWTYAFAFYLNKSNFSEIFESMQDYLNETVEDLSQLFKTIKVLDSPEKTAARIALKKTDIIALALLVTRRRNLLLECAQTGIQQGTLLFFSP